MGSLERRIEQLEALYRTSSAGNPEEDPARSGLRARKRAFLDELAAAKREGRELSPEAERRVSWLIPADSSTTC